MERILKLEFFPMSALGPLAVLRIAEDPTAKMFGLDDENSRIGDENMVNLGRSPGRR